MTTEFDGGPGGCPNDDCPAGPDDYSVASVDVFENSPSYAGQRRSDSDFDGWPTAGDVTHICVDCGFWFHGTTDEYERRREAQARRRERSLEETEEKHAEMAANGWDPVCADDYGPTDDGWANIVENMTPAEATCVALTHMEDDVPLHVVTWFAGVHVSGMSGRPVEQHWDAETIADWGFDNVARYDAFTENAADFM